MSFKYSSGEEVKAGDRITYHCEPGQVEFVISQPTGDAAMDWYLEEFPGGGTMIVTEAMGSVFLEATEDDEDLEFVARKEAC